MLIVLGRVGAGVASGSAATRFLPPLVSIYFSLERDKPTSFGGDNNVNLLHRNIMAIVL